MKKKYYFTFGVDSPVMPFKGGWTLVLADDYEDARRIFTRMHGKAPTGFLPFAEQYDEAQFKATRMSKCGNAGRYCHEVLWWEDGEIHFKEGGYME